MHSRLGADIILNPEVYSHGFKNSIVIEPGWSTPPPALLNSARSFHLRSAYEDEANIVRGVATLKPHRLQFNPRVYWYGNSYIFLLAGWIGASSLISPVTLVPGLGYYLENIDKMAAIFLSGRLLSAAIFWACALLLAFIGKRHFNERAGLIAAGLFLVSPALVIQSHYMKPHLLGAMFILISFSLCADMLKTGNTRKGILAGGVIGLAAAAAIHLSLGVLIVAIAFALRLLEKNEIAAEIKWVVCSALSFFAAFFIVNSYYVTEFTTTMNAMSAVSTFLHLNPLKILTFIFLCIPLALTIPIAAAYAYGLLARGNRNSVVGRFAVISVSVFLLTSIVYSTVDKFDSIRYFGGSLIGFLLAGAAIASGRKEVKALAVVAFVYGLAATSVMNYNFYLDATGRSTRDFAGQWIEKEIPAGSELLLLQLPQPSNSPYFQWNRYRLRFVEPNAIKTLAKTGPLPEYVILTHVGGDHSPIFKPLENRYKRIKQFDSFSLGWIRFPIGQLLANPRVDIFQRSQPLDKTAAASRMTQGIAESL